MIEPTFPGFLEFRFLSTRDWSSPVIEWFGREEFAHAAVIYHEVTGDVEFGARIKRDGAEKAGVQLRPLRYGRSGDVFVREERLKLLVTEKQWKSFWTEASYQLGKPYSVSTILGFICGRDFHDTTGFDCSGLMAYLIEWIGLLPVELRAHVRMITPGGFYLLILGMLNNK